MCIVCVELVKQSITYLEAENACKEMIMSAKGEQEAEHYEDLQRSLREADIDNLDTLLEEGWDIRNKGEYDE